MPNSPPPGTGWGLARHLPKSSAPGVGHLLIPYTRTRERVYWLRGYCGFSMAEKKILLCLGKRKRAVSFNSDESESDKSVLTKKVREEFSDILEKDQTEIIIQVKNEEWNDWVDLKDNVDVPDKSVLQVIAEKAKVSHFLFQIAISAISEIFNSI